MTNRHRRFEWLLCCLFFGCSLTLVSVPGVSWPRPGTAAILVSQNSPSLTLRYASDRESLWEARGTIDWMWCPKSAPGEQWRLPVHGRKEIKETKTFYTLPRGSWDCLKGHKSELIDLDFPITIPAGNSDSWNYQWRHPYFTPFTHRITNSNHFCQWSGYWSFNNRNIFSKYILCKQNYLGTVSAIQGLGYQVEKVRNSRFFVKS